MRRHRFLDTNPALLRRFPRALQFFDFESGTEAFGAGASTSIAQDLTEHISQLASLRVTATAAAGIHQTFAPALALSGPTAGRRYRITGWAKGQGATIGKTMRWVIRVTGGAQAAVFSEQQYQLTANWQFLSVVHTVADNDRTAIQFDHFALAVPALNDIYFLDAIRVIREK